MQPYPQYPQQPPQFPPPVPQYPGGYGYPQQPPQYPAMQPPVAGTLDAFYEQPSGGSGPSWKFNQKPIGTSYTGIVTRPITNADVRQQINPSTNQPVTYKDGRPKFVMIVPMTVQQSPEFPEGVASWWVKGQARDELLRAMAEAGAPAGPPEAGAAIQVTLVGQRPIPGFAQPQLQYRVVYQRPTDAAAVTPAPMPAAAPAPAAQAAPAAPAPVQPALQAPSNLTTEQAALMAQLQGQTG